MYFKVIEQIQKKIKLPIALKISHYFTDLGPMILKLSKTGITGLVLFNRFFSPDFDIEKFEVKPSFFKGKMSQDRSADPAIYDRAQFMRYFGGKKNVTLR